MKINSNQSRDDGHFSSLGNEKNSFRGIENNYKNGFNLNIFQPAGEGTPNSESIRDAVEESMIVRRAEIDIDRIAGEVRLRGIAVHYNTMHISSIGKKLAFDGRIRPWGTTYETLYHVCASPQELCRYVWIIVGHIPNQNFFDVQCS